MKLSLPVLLASSLCATTVSAAADSRLFGRDRPDVKDDILAKFKELNQIRNNAKVGLQSIKKNGKSLIVAGTDISLEDEDLEVVDILADGASVFLDGLEVTSEPLVFRSKQKKDCLITKDVKGKVVSAVAHNDDGTTENIVPVGDGSDTYATIVDEDVDGAKVAAFTLEEVTPPDEDRRGLRSLSSLSIQPLPSDTRELQSTCSSFEVIEISVVVDSLLCANAGGAAEAEALVQSIVAGASQLYEAPGLCVKLQLLDTHLFCNPSNDPISDLLGDAGSSNVCSNDSGILQSFRRYVTDEGLRGDVVHLFHGKDFTGTSTIGCAWTNTLCRDDGFQSGVNEMTFSNTPSSQAKLLAHENGHICSSGHVEGERNDVMFASLCGSDCNNVFGSESRGAIQNRIASTTCTSVQSGPTPTPPAPTSSPVAAPTDSPVPAPTEAPVPAPTEAPVESPVDSPLEPDDIPDVCMDDPDFRFFANGQLEGCDWVEGLPANWIDYVCGFSFILNNCRDTCDNCP